MSGTQELLFGLIFNGVITAAIVTVAVVLGRRETFQTTNAAIEEWRKGRIQRAG
jgi:hypothetical protein